MYEVNRNKDKKLSEKEKQIQEYENKQLIDELLKMPPMVTATAYAYAINHIRYGEDVTEKWETVTQNASALEKAYRKGYYDALQRKAEGAAERSDSCAAALKELKEEFLKTADTIHYYKQKEDAGGLIPTWYNLDGKEEVYKKNAIRIQEIIDKYGDL